MTVRMGLIGLGGIYRAHSSGYRRQPAADVVAVCDSDAARAGEEAANWGAEPFSDYHKLLERGKVDAVDVMLPHSLHEPVVLAALEAGKHVLVEKPITPSVAGTDRLLEAAARSGKVLAVAENTRFVHAYQAIEPLVRSGVIGDARMVRTIICGSEVERLRRRDLWKGRRDGTVGGAILDAGAHSFYLLRWMFGAFEHVSAHSEQLVEESEVEDFAVVVGRLTTGANFVTEFTFTAEVPWNERLEVYGSVGSLIVDQLADPVVKHFCHREDYEGVALGQVACAPKTWKLDSIGDEVVDFVSALEEGRSPLVDLSEIRDAMVAVEAAYASAAAGGKTVEVVARPA